MAVSSFWLPILKLLTIVFHTSGAVTLEEEAHWAHMGFSIINRALGSTLAIIIPMMKIKNKYIQWTVTLLFNTAMMLCIAFMIYSNKNGAVESSSYLEYINEAKSIIIGNWLFCTTGMIVLFHFISKLMQISE